MSKRFFILLIIVILILSGVVFFNFGAEGGRIIKELSSGRVMFPLIIIAGLIDSINPCAFSVLLLTIAFLFSMGHDRKKIISVAGVYILGIYLTYLGIGLGILRTLQFFDIPHFMAKVGASIIILFGVINIIGEIYPSFPIKLKIPQSAHRRMALLMKKGSFIGALALGGFVGLVEFPCTGGPYLLVLGLLHDHATFWLGFGYLLLYNLVFVSPLVIILALASDQSVLQKMQSWKTKESRLMKHWDSIAMIVLGLVILLVI